MEGNKITNPNHFFLPKKQDLTKISPMVMGIRLYMYAITSMLIYNCSYVNGCNGKDA